MAKKKHKLNMPEFAAFPKQLNACRYTFNAWKKTFPQSTEEDWATAMVPDHILDYIAKVFQISQQSGVSLEKIERIKIVTLNDEFFAWLEEHHLKNTEENRSKYAKMIDNETATKLMKESGMDYTIESFALPILIPDLIGTGDVTNFRMSPAVNQYLMDFLYNVYHTEIYVAPYYMTGDAIYDNFDSIANLAKQYFNEHIHLSYEKFVYQHYDESFNLGILYIPFFVKNTFDSALMKTGETLVNKDGALDIKYMPTLATFCQTDPDMDEVDATYAMPFKIPREENQKEDESNEQDESLENFAYDKDSLFGYAVRSIYCGKIDTALIAKDFIPYNISGLTVPLSVYELGDYEASFVQFCMTQNKK